MMNPCPCGYYTNPKKACRCNPTKIQNYTGKISWVLLDGIDMYIDTPVIKYKELTDIKAAESSAAIKARVEKARTIQRERFKENKIFCNTQINSKLIKKYRLFNQEAKELLKLTITELELSAHTYDKILKVSRTSADLADSKSILAEQILETVQYRSLDKELF